MESLRQLALNALIKTGNWKFTPLPQSFLKEFQAVEESIGQNMTGKGYYLLKSQSTRFNINWVNGKWIFDLYGSPWNTEAMVRVILRYNGNYMSSVWSDVFALSCTEAKLHGFWVNRYDLKASRKKVNFYGLYFDLHGRTIRFRAQFTFYPNENFLDVITFGWVPYQPTYRFEYNRRFFGSSEEVWLDTIPEEIVDDLFNNVY